MIRTIKLKLNSTPDDIAVIKKTMEDYTTSYNICSTWGFENKTANKIDNHKNTYYNIRGILPSFPPYLIQSSRDCACEALKQSKCKCQPKRKTYSGMRYNTGGIKVYPVSGYASIATSCGRKKVTFVFPKYYRRYLIWRIKATNVTISRNNNSIYLYCQVEKETPDIKDDLSVLGIDRGIKNITVCSSNVFYNSKKITNARNKIHYLQGQLWSKGTQ